MTLFTLYVSPGECLLERRPGHPTRALSTGSHRRRRRATYACVDLRERLTQLAPQDVPTSDGLSVKVVLAVRWSVADAVAYDERAADPFALVYLAVQVALRDALADVPVEEAMPAARRTLAAPLAEAARTAAAGVGIDVADVVVKDVLLPAEVRRSYAELVSARHESEVKLARARAETAALRSLANAAKLLDAHPALARQRLIEALPYGASVKVALGD